VRVIPFQCERLRVHVLIRPVERERVITAIEPDAVIQNPVVYRRRGREIRERRAGPGVRIRHVRVVVYLKEIGRRCVDVCSQNEILTIAARRFVPVEFPFTDGHVAVRVVHPRDVEREVFVGDVGPDLNRRSRGIRIDRRDLGPSGVVVRCPDVAARDAFGARGLERVDFKTLEGHGVRQLNLEPRPVDTVETVIARRGARGRERVARGNEPVRGAFDERVGRFRGRGDRGARDDVPVL